MRKRFSELSRVSKWRHVRNLNQIDTGERFYNQDNLIASHHQFDINENTDHISEGMTSQSVDSNFNESHDGRNNMITNTGNTEVYGKLDYENEDDSLNEHNSSIEMENDLINNNQETSSSENSYCHDIETEINRESFETVFQGNLNDDEDDLFYSQPVYDQAPISVKQSLLAVLKLKLKHNLTETCISDILKVIQLHYKPQNAQHVSIYHLQKFFRISNNKYSKHYYCVKCLALTDEQNICHKCEQNSTKQYFATLKIADQVNVILNKSNYLELIHHRLERDKDNDCRIADLYDGSLYREAFENDFISNPHMIHISFTWCTDGVPLYKSTKISIWPFYLRINELPYNIRIKRENTILAGLGFGYTHPVPHLFLKQMKTEFESLYNGIILKFNQFQNPIQIRALLLFGTCDLPAKSLFLNITQFNGKFGCASCEYEGQSIQTQTGKKLIVYPFVENLILRTLEKTVNYAQEALENKLKKRNNFDKTSVKGVKGPCIFSKIMPDFIKGTAIDSMHAIYEGVVKKLLYLWFDSSFTGQPFSLRLVMDEIDKLLLNIKPPKFVHRIPRSVKNYYNWKASELKCWFFYYSVPILAEFMRPDFFQHYMLFVRPISILNSDYITPAELINSKNLLSKFVENFEVIYEKRHCTMNIHQLLHLSENVENLGPLWVHSCFSYENINGLIINDVHGTTDIDSQIINSHLQVISFASKLSAEQEGPVLQFLMQQKKQVKIIEQVNDSYSVGTYTRLNEIPIYLHQMQNIDIIGKSVRKYYRLLKRGMLYVAEGYQTNFKTDSSFVKFLYKQRQCFGKLMVFFKITSCDCTKDFCQCEGNHYAVIKPLCILNPFNVDTSYQNIQINHIYEYTITTYTVVVDIMNLLTTCFNISNSSKSYVATPINTVEYE